MNYEAISRGLPQAELEKYAQGVAIMNNLAKFLQGQGLLPERFAQSEVSCKAIAFTDEEKEALKNDGAVIYLPTGETIKSQKDNGRSFWYIANGYQKNGKNRLTEFPARRIEVAIYPDPERFFVPGSFSQTTDQQIALVKTDAHSLREKLGLPNIDEILPEASEVTEILFKHFDATSIRILGQDYFKDGYWSYIRTNTPTNKEGSGVASIGAWAAVGGLDVFDWDRSGTRVRVGAARWVVPTGIR